MIIIESWTQSIDKWIEMFNVPLHASEEWKIDWDLKYAISIVENETLRTMVGVDEYSEIIQLNNNSNDNSNNDKKECIFIKKLYVHTGQYVGIPQFITDLLCKLLRSCAILPCCAVLW